jgi:hypothetical protein
LPFFRIALWIVLLVSAMLLPFLPGRHDPLAASLSMSAVVVCFGGLLLIPIGVVWLTFARRYAAAKAALVVAALVAGAALLAVANGSLAAGAGLLATCVTRLVFMVVFLDVLRPSNPADGTPRSRHSQEAPSVLTASPNSCSNCR